MKVDSQPLRDARPAQVARNYEQLGDLSAGKMRSAELRGRADEAAAAKREAISYYMEAARLNPSRPEPVLQVARLSGDDKHQARAIEVSLQLNPLSPAVWIERGFAHLLDGKYDEAIADYTESIRLEATQAGYHGRASVYLDMDRYEPAIDDLSAAIQLVPDDAHAHHERGDAYKEWYCDTRDERLLQSALADYDTAARLEPDDDSHLSARYVALTAAGRLDEAIDGLSKLIAADDSNFYLFSQRGNAYCEAKRYDAAACDFSKTIELLESQPTPSDDVSRQSRQNSIRYAYERRGAVYRQLGERVRADQDAERAHAMATGE
jgi:tetratricopeptide (TPR) repeat protein